MFFLEVNPSAVKPGWTPLIITILLAAAIALLMISMRRQMRKIRVPHREDLATARAASDDGDAADEDDSSDGKVERPVGAAGDGPRSGSPD